MSARHSTVLQSGGGDVIQGFAASETKRLAVDAAPVNATQAPGPPRLSVRRHLVVRIPPHFFMTLFFATQPEPYRFCLPPYLRKHHVCISLQSGTANGLPFLSIAWLSQAP